MPKSSDLTSWAQEGEVHMAPSQSMCWCFLGVCWLWKVDHNHLGQEIMNSEHHCPLPVFVVATLCTPNQGLDEEGQVPPHKGTGWHPCNTRFVENESSFGFLLYECTQLPTWHSGFLTRLWNRVNTQKLLSSSEQTQRVCLVICFCSKIKYLLSTDTYCEQRGRSPCFISPVSCLTSIRDELQTCGFSWIQKVHFEHWFQSLQGVWGCENTALEEGTCCI